MKTTNVTSGGMREFNIERHPNPGFDFSVNQLPPHSHLDLEIGAGQGLHAIRYTSIYPDRHLIAVEKTHERFGKLQRRSQRHGNPKNLTCIHADAVSFVVHALPDNCLDRVLLLYPNPYQKNSQANLRWYNRPFLSVLKNKMKPSARLELATNMEYYHQEARLSLTTQWGLKLIEDREVESGSPRTHFEKKYLERGEKCWNLVFEKPGLADKLNS